MIVFADSSAVVKLYADEQVAAFEADYHGSAQDQPRFGMLAVTATVPGDRRSARWGARFAR